jgi:hypothetical protein
MLTSGFKVGNQHRRSQETPVLPRRKSHVIASPLLPLSLAISAPSPLKFRQLGKKKSMKEMQVDRAKKIPSYNFGQIL